jgi:hypothetical protein
MKYFRERALTLTCSHRTASPVQRGHVLRVRRATAHVASEVDRILWDGVLADTAGERRRQPSGCCALHSLLRAPYCVSLLLPEGPSSYPHRRPLGVGAVVHAAHHGHAAGAALRVPRGETEGLRLSAAPARGPMPTLPLRTPRPRQEPYELPASLLAALPDSGPGAAAPAQGAAAASVASAAAASDAGSGDATSARAAAPPLPSSASTSVPPRPMGLLQPDHTSFAAGGAVGGPGHSRVETSAEAPARLQAHASARHPSGCVPCHPCRSAARLPARGPRGVPGDQAQVGPAPGGGPAPAHGCAAGATGRRWRRRRGRAGRVVRRHGPLPPLHAAHAAQGRGPGRAAEPVQPAGAVQRAAGPHGGGAAAAARVARRERKGGPGQAPGPPGRMWGCLCGSLARREPYPPCPPL